MANTFTPEQIAQILEEFFKTVGTRQYVGARYVPIFGRKDEDSIEWDNTGTYEPLTIVLYQGNSYTSRQYVPVGVEITNQEFWALTGNYNAQVEQYRRETAAAAAAAAAAQEDIDTLLPKSAFSSEATVKDYVDDLSRIVPFSTVADMQADTTLKSGFVCHTGGFHSVNDGGAAYYILGETGTANGMDVITCGELFANLVITDSMQPEQFGADGTNDVSGIIARMLALGIVIDGRGHSYKFLAQIDPTADMHIVNCDFDFDNACCGMFKRADNEVYKAPTTVFAEHMRFENCKFHDAIDYKPAESTRSSYSAALPIYAARAEIIGCEFYDNKCNGVMAYTDYENMRFGECIVIDGCYSHDNGIYNATDHSITKTAIGIGAYLDVNDIPCKMVISDCVAERNANSGIAPHGINDVTIVNCVSSDNNEHGFVFQSNKTGALSGCIANNNWSRAIRVQGDWNIEPVYCKNIAISACTCRGLRALQIGGGVENVTITGCTFYVNWGSALAFDPQDYPDMNILITNNQFVFDESQEAPSVLGNVRPTDLNVYAVNNYVNGKLEHISGHKLAATYDQPATVFNGAPDSILFAMADHLSDYNVGAATKDGATVVTTGSNATAFYTVMDVSNVKLLTFFADFFISSTGTHSQYVYPYFETRDSAGTLINTYNLSTENVTMNNRRANVGMQFDVAEVLAKDPTTVRIRVGLKFPYSGVTCQLNAFEVGAL